MAQHCLFIYNWLCCCWLSICYWRKCKIVSCRYLSAVWIYSSCLEDGQRVNGLLSPTKPCPQSVMKSAIRCCLRWTESFAPGSRGMPNEMLQRVDEDLIVYPGRFCCTSDWSMWWPSDKMGSAANLWEYKHKSQRIGRITDCAHRQWLIHHVRWMLSTQLVFSLFCNHITWDVDGCTLWSLSVSLARLT